MNKWMKIVGSVVTAALIVTVFAGIALAQGPGDDSDGVRDRVGLSLGHAWGFVDEDGDGINDRYTEDCDGSEFVDEDGDGVCDLHGEALGEGYGRGIGRGAHLMDGADYADGECDGTPVGGQMMGRRAAGR
ncbi:MAG: hypothetical protein ACOYZ7_07255 [Chloroflexota bacterium]